MPQNITPQHLDAQATTVNLRGINIRYSSDDAVTGGHIQIEYRDASGNVIESENVHFTAAQFGAWNGTPAQALAFAVNNSQRIQ